MLMHWQPTFTYRGRTLPYNRIPLNNYSERAVEIPIAFDFLARRQHKQRVLEVGHVLTHYESVLSAYLGFWPRRIVDKFEEAMGVDNIDMMDLSPTEPYDTIVCLSTVEHVGQGGYGEKPVDKDREAPLKAIAKLYEVLTVGGAALITVPFGRLVDLGWLIQFSLPYLELLWRKYGIPEEDIAVYYMKRLGSQLDQSNPHQIWVEATPEELAHIHFHWPLPYGSAIAIIELNRQAPDFQLHFDLPPDPLKFEADVRQNLPSEQAYQVAAILKRLRDLNFLLLPDWQQSDDALYESLAPVLKTFLHHPDGPYLALLLATPEAAKMDVLEQRLLGFLDKLNLNTMLGQPTTGELILVDPLTSAQWEGLLTCVTAVLPLTVNDEAMIPTATLQSMALLDIEQLRSGRVTQLPSGACILN